MITKVTQIKSMVFWFVSFTLLERENPAHAYATHPNSPGACLVHSYLTPAELAPSLAQLWPGTRLFPQHRHYTALREARQP